MRFQVRVAVADEDGSGGVAAIRRGTGKNGGD